MPQNRIAIVGARPPQGKGDAPPSAEELEQWLMILSDLYAELNRIWREDEPSLIVSGGALGVDEYAAAVMKRAGQKVVVFLPDYDKYAPRVAPLERNKLIAQNCDVMHAWPAPWSTGTHHATNQARSLGKTVIVHTPWELPF